MTDIDITERLRTRGGRLDGFGLGPICDEAAAEIDRLRAQVANPRETPFGKEAEKLADDYIRLSSECAALRAQVATYRLELERVNNEFGSQTADWPDAWQRVAEIKQIAGRNWRENEELRAQVAEMREDAERYRWLRAQSNDVGSDGGICIDQWHDFQGHQLIEVAADQAIDAAIDRARKSEDGGRG